MHLQTKWSWFSVLVCMFIFLGFVAASNDILTAFLKENLSPDSGQLLMIFFVFFIANAVGSRLFYVVAKAGGKGILGYNGYQSRMLGGLMIYASGALFIYPAAQTDLSPLIVAGLCFVGLDLFMQKTAANAPANDDGYPGKGMQRLSLAGGLLKFETLCPVLLTVTLCIINGSPEIARFFLPVSEAAGFDFTLYYVTCFMIVSIMIARLLNKEKLVRQLLTPAFIGTAALATGIFRPGLVSVCVIISLGLLRATLWPAHFTLKVTSVVKQIRECVSLPVILIRDRRIHYNAALAC